MTFSKFELTIWFSFFVGPYVKNQGYFALLHKSSGHRDTPHKTGTNPGKPGTYGHPRIEWIFLVIFENKFGRQRPADFVGTGGAPPPTKIDVQAYTHCTPGHTEAAVAWMCQEGITLYLACI